MKIYNKLVRDKIPAIIEIDGKMPEIVCVTGQEISRLLEDKLIEEFNEYLEDRNLEELADMMEVIFGMASQLGYTDEELLVARGKKLEERGGFKEGVFLKSVRE
ncbi:MAG: nucleoside triphosphate pyrophosphohydrolase [Cellulosilyticaceae bacterium]